MPTPITRAEICAAVAAFAAGATVGALSELARALHDARRQQLLERRAGARALNDLEEQLLAESDEKIVRLLSALSLQRDVEKIHARRELVELVKVTEIGPGPFDGVPQARGEACARTGGVLCFDALQLWASEGTGAGLEGPCSCAKPEDQ